MWLARVSGFGVVVMQLCLAACSTAPVVDRARIVDVPLAGVQSDIEFSITSASRADMSCAENSTCSTESGRGGVRFFAQEVERIAGVLEKGALKLYPDPAWCTPRLAGGCFDVYIVEGDEPGSSSSANGRIALHAALGRWQAYDGVLAFVIAREMGHVIARHHEENSSLSIATSVLLNIFMPVSGLFKSLMSIGGARLAATSNRDVQAMEADAIAANLLETSAFRSTDIAKSLLIASLSLDESSWSKAFRKSAKQFVSSVRASESAVASAKDRKSGDRRELTADKKCSLKITDYPCWP
jgi:hypothetical protein